MIYSGDYELLLEPKKGGSPSLNVLHKGWTCVKSIDPACFQIDHLNGEWSESKLIKDVEVLSKQDVWR